MAETDGGTETGSGAENVAGDWREGLSESNREWVESKGIKDPDTALTSYRNLEKMVGADKAGRTVVLPGETATDADRDAFYERLGRPKEASGYELPVPEGQSDAFAKTAAAKFHELGITGDQGRALAAWWNEHAAGLESQRTTEYRAQLATEEATLRTEWGAAFDAKVASAKAAVSHFGVDPSVIDGFESRVGFAETMKFMAKVGALVQEDTFEQGGDRSRGTGVMTPAEAKEELRKLQADPEFLKAWTKRDHPGHAAALDKRRKLSALAHPTR